MRVSRRTIHDLTTELLRQPTRPKACARCNYVFKYPEDTPWNEVFELICEHWETCLAEISGDSSLPARQDTPTSRRVEESPSPSDSSEDIQPMSGKRRRTESQSSGGHTRRRKKNIMDKGARRRLIENDVWARDATSKTVGCRGCGRTIKLDKRSDYYPGLWLKHRNKCPAIKRLEAKKRHKGEVKSEPSRFEEYTETAGSRPQATSVDETKPERLATRWKSPIIQVDSAPSYAASRSPSGSTTPEPKVEYYCDSSDDEEYWHRAPFETDRAGSPDTGRTRYRYSTRLELATSYKDVVIPDRESWSEDVIQAAQCLVSLKRRGSS